MNESYNVVRENNTNVDEELVRVGEECEKNVLDEIKREKRYFSSQTHINTRVRLSKEVVHYIRLVSVVTDEKEVDIKRGLIAYGKVYLYGHLYNDVKKMKEYERILVEKNRFIRDSVGGDIPSPIQFSDRVSVGIRISDEVYGALLNIADYMRLSRAYIIELAIWTSFKFLFIQDDTINGMLGADKKFINSLEIYDTLETYIKDLCNDYKDLM